MAYDNTFLSSSSNGQSMDWYLRRRLIETNENDPMLYINRFHLPDLSDELEGTRQFVFMTRPDLNLFYANTELIQNVSRIPLISDMANDMSTNLGVLRSLQIRGTSFSSPFLPIFSNMCRGYTTTDTEIESVEIGESIFGNKVVYGKHNYKSRAAGTISLPFKDNKNLFLYKTIKVWIEYIEHVSVGLCSPRRQDIIDSVLDYASSIYYIVTKSDMQELIYWEKLVGVFPVNIPDSTFSYKEGDSIDPEHTVTFRYAFKDRSMNPLILSDLNLVAKTSGVSGSYVDNWDKANRMHGDTYMVTPFIEKSGNKYLLRWWK